MSVALDGDAAAASAMPARAAQRLRLGGRVQDVGFRPFVYRLARLHGLCGWVRNDGGEVVILIEGPADRLQAFRIELLTRAPPAAAPHLEEACLVGGEGQGEFRILASTRDGESRIHIPVDLFTCDECLAELNDARARRHRYPFINCTQCGPRYTLIRAMPYDRTNTTLDQFDLCSDCAAEYADPMDRRFHAEPLACAVCGPVLSWRDESQGISGNAPALAAALASLRGGRIVAVRGVGGYHLLCDARDERAVARLRARKGRPARAGSRPDACAPVATRGTGAPRQRTSHRARRALYPRGAGAVRCARGSRDRVDAAVQSAASSVALGLWSRTGRDLRQLER